MACAQVLARDECEKVRPRAIPVAEARSPTIDIARGIAILLVIYSHALEPVFGPSQDSSGLAFLQWKFIYAFHMPLFFMLSGAVYKIRPTGEVLARSLSFLLLAYLFHILGWLVKTGLHWLGSLVHVSAYDSIGWGHLLKPFIDGDYFTIRIMWFFFALALIQLAYHLYYVSSPLLRACVAASLFFIFMFYVSSGHNYFQIASVVPGVIFYGLGHAISRYDVSRFGWPLAIGALIATAILTPLNHGCYFSATDHCGIGALNGAFAVWMVIGRTGFIPLFILTAVLGSLAIIAISAIIARHRGQLSESLSTMGVVALDAVLLNGLFLEFVNPFAGREILAHSATPYVGVLWFILMIGAQLVLLPSMRKVFAPMTDATQRMGRALTRT